MSLEAEKGASCATVGKETADHILNGVKLGTYFKLSLKYEEIIKEIFTRIPGDKELLDGANR